MHRHAEANGDKGVIFDGIPRKMEQKETFDALMEKLNRNFKAILVDVPKEEAIKRLTSRRICTECKEVYPAMYKGENCEKCEGTLMTRTDDNPESINTRIQAYFDETMPVIEKYKEENKLIPMDGDQSIEDVRDDVFQIVENLPNN